MPMLWNPKANGAVDAIVISGRTVYAGGAFTEIGGSLRERVAAICAIAKCEGEVGAGNATALESRTRRQPSSALAISGPTVYLGGEFTKAGGSARKDIAAVCAVAKCEGVIAAGKATAWKPNSNAKVQALTVSGTNAYAAGAFTEVAAEKRNFVAELNASGTVKAEAWNPNANKGLFTDAITVDSTTATAYIGGSLSSVGGEARENIAALNSSNEVNLGIPAPTKPSTRSRSPDRRSTLVGNSQRSAAKLAKTSPQSAPPPNAKAKSRPAKPPHGTPKQTAPSMRL